MFVIKPADRLSYAYLFGAYLGDGYVADTGRSFQLVITLDATYPDIIEECRGRDRAQPARVTTTRHPHAPWPARSASRRAPSTGPTSSRRWVPGRKHERPIVLAPGSARSSSRHPWPFVRGLIHSDGCRTVNRFKTRLPSGRVAEYAYPRYFFSNLSADIRGLFCESCERLGLRWTQSNHRNISISHRASVALLDENVGPKC